MAMISVFLYQRTLHDQSEKRKQPYDAHQNQNDVCDGVSDQPVSFHGS